MKPIDTTAAGDSFNAALYGGAAERQNPVDAATAGASVWPAEVIRHRGAIMPRNAAAVH